MHIPPISNQNSTGFYSADWQKTCDQMQLQITNDLNTGQMDQLNGYLSTLIQFAQGLGNDTPQKIAFTQAMVQLYTDAGTKGNWQKDLTQLRTLLPPNLSSNEITQAFKNILNSNTETMPGQSSADYISGLQLSLSSLLPFASNKDAKILTSCDLQNSINAFIQNPEEEQADALHAAIKAASAKL